MARVKLSALLVSIAGRYGGGVFRNWKGTTVLSILPSSVANPATAKQEAQRSVLACMSKAWAGLSTEVRNDWRTVASALSEQWGNYSNPVGTRSLIYPPRGPYTGLGALTSVAGLKSSIAGFACGDAIPAAPVNVGGPGIPILGTLSGDDAGFVIPWTKPSNWGENSHEGHVRVWVKSENGTFHAQIAGYGTGIVETITVTELVPRGGVSAVPIRPGYYTVQLDAVNEEGLRGAPSAVAEFLIEEHVV